MISQVGTMIRPSAESILSNCTGTRENGERPEPTNEIDESAIEIRNLTKVYGTGNSTVEALTHVTTTIERGSITGILGANGAGKTTLMKAILGLVLPTEGIVRVEGVEVFDEGNVHPDVAVVLEGARNIYWRLTPRENVEFFARLHGVASRARSRQVDRTVDSVGLAEKADVPVKDLSRGMKQRCALACALVRDARVLLLDEPTLGLDVGSRERLLSTLKTLAERDGRTIVLSSHDMDVIEDVCDRVLVIDEGTIVADGSVAELKGAFEARTCSITLEQETTPVQKALLAESFETANWRIEGGRTQFELTCDDPAVLSSLIGSLQSEDLYVHTVERAEPDLGEIFTSITDGGIRKGSGGIPKGRREVREGRCDR